MTEVCDPVANAYSRLLGELSRILENGIMEGFMKQMIYLECSYFGDPFASVAFVFVGVSDIVCSLEIYYLEYLTCIY